MKKQFYSIAALALMCCASAIDANNVTGLTFLRPVGPFDNGSPLMINVTETAQSQNKKRHNKKSMLQVVAFGGQNASQASAAAYYMPSDQASWTVSDAPTNTPVINFAATNIGLMASRAWTSGATPVVTGTAYNVNTTALALNAISDTTNTVTAGPIISVASATKTVVLATANSTTNDRNLGTGPGYNGGIYLSADGTRANAGTNLTQSNIINDVSTDTSVLKAWNFGITNAAAWDPILGFTAGSAAFNSTIAPTLKITQGGAGISYRYQFSDDATGFFLKGSTAVQCVRSQWNWNENVVTAAGALAAAWSNGGFPSGTNAPANLAQAFAQTSWLYGRVNGAQKITRLADIELLMGYEIINEDTHHTNAYLGLVIPTGNKAKGLYLAEAQVGNGGHFGLMYGGTLEMQMSKDEDFVVTTRIDGNFRYLFQNTQVRAVDLVDRPWSRYMMVWPNYATFATASTVTASEYAFTPGINVFTQSVKVTPGSQLRINSAILLESDHFKGELGCGMLSRQAEKVILANAWAAGTVALAASNPTGINNSSTAAINPARTIFNNNVLDQIAPGAAVVDTSVATGITIDNPIITQAEYTANCVNATDLNLDNAASPASLSYIPYLALGYAWGEDKTPGFVNVGGSYEFSLQNAYSNQWQVWAKLGFSF